MRYKVTCKGGAVLFVTADNEDGVRAHLRNPAVVAKLKAVVEPHAIELATRATNGEWDGTPASGA